MNNEAVTFIRGQLQVLRDSTNLDYSKGVADGLLAYLDATIPKEVTLKLGRYDGFINAIKAVRQETGLGLKEAKDLVESRGVLYKGTDLTKAMILKNKLESVIEIEVIGDSTIGLLFGKT